MLSGLGVSLLPVGDGQRAVPSSPSRQKPPFSLAEGVTKYWQSVACTGATGGRAGPGMSSLGC